MLLQKRILNLVIASLLALISINSFAQSSFKYNVFQGDTMMITINNYVCGNLQWQIRYGNTDDWIQLEDTSSELQYIIPDTLEGSVSLRSVVRLSEGSTFPIYSDIISADVVTDIEELNIGSFYMQGGIVFYLDTLTNRAYITPPHDFYGNYKWGCKGDINPGADGIHIGSGLQNTLDIIDHCDDVNTSAYFANQLVYNQFDDWYLPSRQELFVMKSNVANIIERTAQGYIKPSSTEYSEDAAYCYSFLNGHVHDTIVDKSWSYNIISVQPIRDFDLTQNHLNTEYVINVDLHSDSLSELILLRVDTIFKSDYYFSLAEQLPIELNIEWDFKGGEFIEINGEGEYLVRYYDDIYRNVCLNIYDNDQLVVPEILSHGFYPSIHSYYKPLDESVNFGTVDYGDYNNDNKLDVLAVGSGKTLVIKNCGLDSVHIINDDFYHLDHAVGKWGDFNNDNFLDFIISGHDSTAYIASIFINNGNDSFVESGDLITGVSDGDIECLDFDNDGFLDILISGETSDTLPSTILYKNVGGSFYQIFQDLKQLKNSGIESLDYNQDGYLDFIIQGKDSLDQRHSILYENHFGSFIPTAFTFLGRDYGDFSKGDYDNDGDLDLLVTGFKSDPIIQGNVMKFARTSTLTLYKNNNGESWEIIKDWTSVNTYGRSENSFVDYDNDGDLDLYVNGSVGGVTIVYVGIGGGSVLADGTLSCVPRVYRNMGSNIFQDTEMDLPCIRNDANGAAISNSFQSYSFDLGDYNNDRLVDFIRTGSGASWLPTSVSIYNSTINSTNLSPEIISDLSIHINDSLVKLNWIPGLDDHTPSQSLQYKVYLRDCFNNYYLSKVNTDYVADTFQIISGLGPGYYLWSVRARDGALISGDWSEESSFIIPSDSIEICQGDSVLLYGSYRYESGLYFDTISGVNGNDSLLITNIILKDLPELYLSPVDTTVCSGTVLNFYASGNDNYIWSTGDTLDQITSLITDSTEIYVTTTGENSCSTTAFANLYVFPLDTVLIEDLICQGDTYDFNGQIISEAGTYYFNTSSILTNCDSVVVLNLFEGSTYFYEEAVEICDNESINWHGEVYSISGLYYDSLNTVIGCDSIYQLLLSVHPLPSEAGVIDGISAVYQGEMNVVYTIPPINNATSYSWSLPIGATGESTTNSILVDYSPSSESGEITVKGINSCGEGDPSTLSIIIIPLLGISNWAIILCVLLIGVFMFFRFRN